MTTNSKEKNGISGRLVKSMLSNRFQWTNLHEQPQNGPVTDDFVHSPRKWPLTTLSCGKHCTALSIGFMPRLRQTLLATSRTRNQPQERMLSTLEAEHLSATNVSVTVHRIWNYTVGCQTTNGRTPCSSLGRGCWSVAKQHQTHVRELAANKIPVVQCGSCAQQHTLFDQKSIRGHADGINCFDCWMSWISRRSSIHQEPASKRGLEGASSDSAQVQSSPIKTKVEWDFDFAHDLEDSKSTSGDPVWEVEHLSLSVGCVRNKRQFHTDRRNWKIFFW